MTETPADTNDLSLRIVDAKDRLSRLLEAAATDRDSSQVNEFIDEEEAEIMQLEISTDGARVTKL